MNISHSFLIMIFWVANMGLWGQFGFRFFRPDLQFSPHILDAYCVDPSSDQWMSRGKPLLSPRSAILEPLAVSAHIKRLYPFRALRHV